MVLKRQRSPWTGVGNETYTPGEKQTDESSKKKKKNHRIIIVDCTITANYGFIRNSHFDNIEYNTNTLNKS